MSSGRCHALMTGITGQDGSHAAELLLEKGYTVRRTHSVISLRSTDSSASRAPDRSQASAAILASVHPEAPRYERLKWWLRRPSDPHRPRQPQAYVLPAERGVRPGLKLVASRSFESTRPA